MEFWILGPLEVTRDGRPLALGETKQQLVLGALLLSANRLVRTEQLADELWGESPPPSSSKLVQLHVSGLRKVLGRDMIVTRPGGYLFRVDPGRLDANRFERLAAEARTSRSVLELADRLRSALGLWRGTPLNGLELQSSARHEVVRLVEQRMMVLEQRIEADLALGRHAELVGELRALAADQPLRETVRGQLMLALYRCGRQAEALRTYREGRRILADGLALAPSAALQQLECRILRHDPELHVAAARPRALVGSS